MTHDRTAPALFVGLGCRRGCSVDELALLLMQTLRARGWPVARLAGLASLTLKADEPGLRALAERLALPLRCFEPHALHAFEPQLTHRSAAAWRATGCWGVAESAALALANQHGGSARLIVPRVSSAQATLAMACHPIFAG
ncbi:cobalamin biosynthesis protein [Pseudomonas sp. 22-AL-CL-001]|uniref:cobalamin biosynthesis protein n=1 Tax=Pseudomonas alabamensis TaxID=3064349 RepID=UPI0027143E4D|nr:cobalamin biosynthesis protein [Pseudomonas sp. 22-AL-CL-001]MDO7910552.1 cobalamin biosynthesis protein [Pseudomonas sp. 22-AL-CL-001]